MLALACRRTRQRDGGRILEPGCGWGSLRVWMTANYPEPSIAAVSNSRTPKQYTDGGRARFSQPLDADDDRDWMARDFFTGGLMPNGDLLPYFEREVRIHEHWQPPRWPYQLTREAWLQIMDGIGDTRAAARGWYRITYLKSDEKR